MQNSLYFETISENIPCFISSINLLSQGMVIENILPNLYGYRISQRSPKTPPPRATKPKLTFVW